MDRVGIFYGSTEGGTTAAAEKISQELRENGFSVYLKNIADVSVEEIGDYENIILGASTWGMEVVQEDWDQALEKLSNADFKGKKLALFGTGDQESYPDTFVDGLGILYDSVSDFDTSLVGGWSPEGYKFRESKALRDGRFVGLVLDDEIQPNHTSARIKEWVKQISNEFKNPKH